MASVAAQPASTATAADRGLAPAASNRTSPSGPGRRGRQAAPHGYVWMMRIVTVRCCQAPPTFGAPFIFWTSAPDRSPPHPLSRPDSIPHTMADNTPIALAEELLRLVKSVYSAPDNAASCEDQKLFDARIRVQRLADELTRQVCGPLEYTVILAESCHESAALRFVTEYGVADAIGDDAKSLSDICKEVRVNQRYMDVAMKSLVTRGYFEEVGGFNTRVFKNNAMSDVLRKDHPQTLKDAVEFICDDAGKASAYLVEATRSTDPTGKDPIPALNLAFGFEGSVFQHWANPAHAWRAKRMGNAMKQLHQMANGNVVTDFPWQTLASPIVDVGGGIGSLELALTKTYPDSTLNFIIMDIPDTLKNARTVWETQPPDARARVSFAAGDFLAPSLEMTGIPRGQPTYLIRHVLHDWTDEEVVSILRNVRAAMLAPPPSVSESDSEITPDNRARETPKLLLCEMLLHERSGRFAYTTSLQVLALNNGNIRTEPEMTALLERAGFRVVVKHIMRAVDSIIEAVPTNV